jgi:TolB-like protein/cytochrome c-type biogenesis protein CcmH/NrfG
MIVGTFSYMSPEQAKGQELDARTDLFSFGVVLYEMVTGTLAFPGRNSGEMLEALFTREPPSLAGLNPSVPVKLQELISKALEKDRTLRYQSAAEMRADLQRLKRDSTAQRSAARARAPSSEVQQPATEAVRKPRPGVLYLAFGTILVIAAVTALWLDYKWNMESENVSTAQQSGIPSIAVLPFVNMSADKNQEYFSDGLTEELLDDLAKIAGLRVTARTSSFQFKEKTEDLRVIAKKLNVTNILEGSVRKEGNRVRITAQLVSAADGFHLWSETYDKELDDVFAVQEEIARNVAGALKVKLLGQKASKERSTNVDAYNAYLQGRYFNTLRDKENLEKAVSYFEQAIQLDPGYAPVWAGLSEARSFQADWGYIPIDEGYEKARDAAKRAQELDGDLAEAHVAMARIQTYHDWDWEEADKSFQRALALEPGNAAVAVEATQLYSNLGRFDEVIALDRRATQLDPLNVTAQYYLGLHMYYSGEFKNAMIQLKHALELNNSYPNAHAVLGQVYLAQSLPKQALAEMEKESSEPWRLQGLALAYHALGQQNESDAVLKQFINQYDYNWAYAIAEVYAFRGEIDIAFSWMERAYEQRDGGITEMKVDPLMKNLRNDPRYSTFLKKMRLPAD